MRWAGLLVIWLLAGTLPALEVNPAVLRVSPAPGAVVHRTVQVQAPAGATLLAIETECPCVRAVDALPQAAHLPVRLAFTGALPGVKTVRIRTTQGTARLTALVDVAGAADGAAVLRTLAARHPGAAVWLVAHDVGDATANCGCSTGSLGGVELLAGLPGAVTAAGLRPTAVLTGTVGAMAGEVLEQHGWRRGAAEIPVGGVADLRPGVVAVVATGPGPDHARVLRPVPGGLLVEVVVLDGQGGLAEVARLPVDRSLPKARGVAAGAGKPVHPRVGADPSRDCAGCHASAHASWATSRHALAWTSLPAEHRTTACAACHVTGPMELQPAAGVHCQACHRGTEGHVKERGRMRTGGTVDCRGCHDAAHDPGFDPVGRWLVIQHGR